MYNEWTNGNYTYNNYLQFCSKSTCIRTYKRFYWENLFHLFLSPLSFNKFFNTLLNSLAKIPVPDFSVASFLEVQSFKELLVFLLVLRLLLCAVEDRFMRITVLCDATILAQLVSVRYIRRAGNVSGMFSRFEWTALYFGQRQTHPLTFIIGDW